MSARSFLDRFEAAVVDWTNDVEARTEARRARTAAARAEIVALPGRLRANEARRAELIAAADRQDEQ